MHFCVFASNRLVNISDDEASIIAEKVIGEFTDEQQNSTVSLEVFEKTLQTLGFNDKMGLKLLK